MLGDASCSADGSWATAGPALKGAPRPCTAGDDTVARTSREPAPSPRRLGQHPPARAWESGPEALPLQQPSPSCSSCTHGLNKKLVALAQRLDKHFAGSSPELVGRIWQRCARGARRVALRAVCMRCAWVQCPPRSPPPPRRRSLEGICLSRWERIPRQLRHWYPGFNLPLTQAQLQSMFKSTKPADALHA